MKLPLPRLTLKNRSFVESCSSGDGRTPSHLAKIPKSWPEFARMTKIRSGTEMISFDPYDYQLRISETIDKTRGVVVVKPRQHGLTEMVANKFLHKACLHPTYFAAVFSKGQDDTANIALRVRMMASSAGIRLSSNNVKDIRVDGGGRIVFRTASPDSGRGLESVWDLLFDECAFVGPIDQIFAAATPSQSLPEQQGKAHTILLSTPNRKDGLYFETLMDGNGDRHPLEICEQMRSGEMEPYQEWIDDNNWGKCFVHWKAHPIHGQNSNYLDDVKNKQRITDAQLQREYNLSFDDASGGVLFNEAAIAACAVGKWEDPKPRHRYLVSVDPNFGGDDFWVTRVWDITNFPVKLVGGYRAQQKSVDYSIEETIRLIESYDANLTAIESNSGGRAVLERIIKRLPFRKVQGVNTSRTSKIVNTDRVAIAIEQREMIYPADWAGIQEMKRFTLKERCASAGHDDEVMAAAIAWAVMEEVERLESVVSRLELLS